MLNEEQGDTDPNGLEEPLSYASYMRVPELLALQTPLASPPVHDEMLFIVEQQAQELWFKQLLYELRSIIDLLGQGEAREAVRLLARANKIMAVLINEVSVLETMPPQEFQRFRHVLTPSSGFESAQFREIELASGLNDPTFLKVVGKHMDLDRMRSYWPHTLSDIFRKLLSSVNPDPVAALVCIYRDAQRYPELFSLAEALSEYEVLFGEWRFRHIKLAERAIGDLSPGTAGSSGVGYLSKTLAYRFFPELWEARNRLSASAR